jgi:hypothetical protein
MCQWYQYVPKNHEKFVQFSLSNPFVNQLCCVNLKIYYCWLCFRAEKLDQIDILKSVLKTLSYGSSLIVSPNLPNLECRCQVKTWLFLELLKYLGIFEPTNYSRRFKINKKRWIISDKSFFGLSIKHLILMKVKKYKTKVTEVSWLVMN